jgi:predicted AAA+ superfamily ATPase
MSFILERTIKSYIKNISNKFKVILLTGQRQVGKSTLLKDLANEDNRKYVTLNDLKSKQLAKNDPELFIQQNHPPIVIDEVQYAFELFPYIKIYVDEHQEEKGTFWLTGSQKISLMRGVQESLPGMVAIINLLGLSYKEKIGKPYNSKPFVSNIEGHQVNGKKLSELEVYERIWEGSFPGHLIDEIIANKEVQSYKNLFHRYRYRYRLYMQPYIEEDVRDSLNLDINKHMLESSPFILENPFFPVLDNPSFIFESHSVEPVSNKIVYWKVFYDSYIKSYIERDVKDFCDIEKSVQFYNFICTVAANTACLVNYDSLAKDVNINRSTVEKWMGILKQLGIVYLLHPYHSNITKRIVKTPKVYFLDTGLCSYLTHWNTPENLMQGSMNGPILETYVLGEILKSYWHNGEKPLIYFYRDLDKNEIDFVIEIEEDRKLYPIEVKKNIEPNTNDFEAFKLISCLGKKTGTGAVVCLHPEKIYFKSKVVSIPVWEI